MSDSTPDISQIEASQSGKETTANRNINMGLTMFGIVKIVGFVVSYAGGRLNGTHVNAGTVTLGASATYYIVAHRSTLAVTAATSTTNWDDDATYGRVAKVVMGASTYTSWEDHRFGTDGIFPLSGSVTLRFRDKYALSDESTAITTGTAKLTIRWPYPNSTLTEVRAELNTASSSGTPTVDINEGGTSILSTKLTIDASEKTSATAASAAVISDANIADDAEVTFDIDTAGTGAKGLKVTMIGYYTL